MTKKEVRRRILKRILSILLVLLLIGSLAGCMLYDLDPVDSSYSSGLQIVTKGSEGSARSTDEALQTQPITDAAAPDTTVPATEPAVPTTEPATEPGLTVTEDGIYDSKEEVALYIHLFRHLPSNYITKKQAEALGWPGGDLRPYAPGKCIGGSHFGNYEGLLPDAKGREWTECDIGTMNAKSRGAKRIIFSNDGLIYYTDDHYESFTRLYDGWED